MPLYLHVRRPKCLQLAGAALVLALWIGAAAPAVSAVFIDAAGRRINLPDNIRRVLPAERNAEVLVYALAPDRLAGLERLPGKTVKMPSGARPPLLQFRPDATPESVAQTARDYRADLIIDAGPVTPERAAFADSVQQRSGISYILVYDGFNRLQQSLAALGQIFGVKERADELRLFAEYDITRLRGRLLILPPEGRPHVYYALGPDGLTTALPGSPAGAAIDEAGAINVAGKLGHGTLTRISVNQLLSWNPDIILVADRRFYNALLHDRIWRGLSAVQGKKVYLEPNEPYDWISNPPGINRLIGLYWLSSLFYHGDIQQEMRGVTCEFYDKFYRQRLTNAQLNALLASAGEPPAARAVKPINNNRSPRLSVEPAVPQSRALPDVGNVPVIPGTELGVPGGPTGPEPIGLPDQPDALCTVPGVAVPLTNTPLQPEGPGTPGLPSGRIRQPGTGGLDTPGLPSIPMLPASPSGPEMVHP